MFLTAKNQLFPVSVKSVSLKSQNFRGLCDSLIFTSFDQGPPSPGSRVGKISPSPPTPSALSVIGAYSRKVVGTKLAPEHKDPWLLGVRSDRVGVGHHA